MTERLDHPRDARAWCATARAAGRTIGFVPTMGALHEGHLELVRRAASENDAAVVSVFVNPLQFNDPADFARYPRDFAGDVRLLASAGCAMAFTGTLEGFFPGELDAAGGLPAGRLLDPGAFAEGLEGAFRPGHFAGVATIVDRLFDIVAPTRAYFGEKDYQQSLVVRDLARRRGGPPVVVCTTEREPGGLARSSRNQLLRPDERERARALSRALLAARAQWAAGVRDADRLRAVMLDVLTRAEIEVEYAALRDPERWTAAEPRGELARAQGLIAARVGKVRLIDTLRLDGDAT